MTETTEREPTEHNENEYLEMANHAKQLIEKKEKIIKVYVSRLDDVEGELRELQYMVSNMGYLLEYKMKQYNRGRDQIFYSMLDKAYKSMYKIINDSRDMCDVDDNDIEVAISFEL